MNLYFNLLNLLSKKHKYKMMFLQLFFLVAAIFQVGGIASIAPFIAVISNPDLVSSNEMLSWLNTYLGSESLADFLIYYALLVAGFIVISNSVAAYALWFLFKFSVSVGLELQDRLYSKYLANQYTFFAMNNSSNLMANITQQIPRFVYMVLQPTLHLVSQVFIALIIIAGLIYMDPMMAAISMMLVGGIYLCIYLTVRKEMVRSGAVITEVTKRKLLLLNESLGGIKEVKLLGIELWYEKELTKTTSDGLNANAFVGLAGDLPKFIVESVVFSGILVLAIYLLFKHGADGSVMSILSFYAMAGYKILPAAQTIYKSMSSVKANGEVVEILRKEFERADKYVIEPSVNTKKTTEFSSLDVTLSNIDYKYPSTDRLVLDKLSLTIKHKSITSFVGGSGAGKSTAVDIILGLLTPLTGKFFVGGELINSDNIAFWQKKIGFVPQNIFLLDDTVVKNIAFGEAENEINFTKVIEAAKKANIHEFIEALPGGYDCKVGERGGQLSGGQKQRIGIARALYRDPEILILDEATSALDMVTEQQILGEIRKLANRRTVIMIAHRLSTVIDSDSICVFSGGQVVAEGSYEELAENSLEFKKLLKAGEGIH